MNEIHIRFIHAPQELSCVGGQALHIPALPFRVQGVKRQGTFARTGEPGYYHHVIPRDMDIHVFQVVNPGSGDMYFLWIDVKKNYCAKVLYFALRNFFT